MSHIGIRAKLTIKVKHNENKSKLIIGFNERKFRGLRVHPKGFSALIV